MTRTAYDLHELAPLVGLRAWQLTHARMRGLLPLTDPQGRYPATVVDTVRAAVPDILASCRDTRVGASEAAGRLEAETGLDVTAADIWSLAAAHVIAPVGEYKSWPVYSWADLQQLADDPWLRAELEQHITGRAAYDMLMIWPRAAAQQLGWTEAELRRVAEDRRIPTRGGTPYRRYARIHIDQLAADTDLMDSMRRQRTVDAHEAAALLEIRLVDLYYLVSAGITRPGHRRDQPGPDDQSDVDGGVWAVGDLEDLRESRRVDWESVRGVQSGKRSPLRALAPALPTYAAQIRALAAGISTVLGVEVRAVWVPDRSRRRLVGGGTWRLEWTTDAAGRPNDVEVDAAIRAHHLRRYRRDLTLRPTRPAPTPQGATS